MKDLAKYLSTTILENLEAGGEESTLFILNSHSPKEPPLSIVNTSHGLYDYRHQFWIKDLTTYLEHRLPTHAYIEDGTPKVLLTMGRVDGGAIPPVAAYTTVPLIP